MDENQQAFIAWLREELESKDDADFQQKVEQLGEQGIREAHINFKKSLVKEYMHGGKLNIIKKLTQFLQNGGTLVNGGTKAVQNYQQMLNEKHHAGLKEDGAWGIKTQTAYEKYLNIKSNTELSKPLTGNNSTAQLQNLPKEIKQEKEKFNPITGSDNVSRLINLPQENIIQPQFNFLNSDTTSRIPDIIKNETPKKLVTNFQMGTNPLQIQKQQAGYFDIFSGKQKTIPTESKNTNFKIGTNPLVALSKPQISSNTEPVKYENVTPEFTKEQTVKQNDTGLLDQLAGKINDGVEMAKNWWERNQAKDNPNLKERVSSIRMTDINKPILTGDTIKDSARRYHLPEVIDLQKNKFGVRNRGQNTLINTPGGVVTSFDPFVNSKEYFSRTKDADNSSYIGVDDEGQIKVGQKKDFMEGNFKVSKTFSNRVVDINKDAKGNFVLENSNPNASKNTLSPTISVLGEDGKIKNGKMNILLPKETNGSKSYDLVTGGRYIMKTPDGETKMVSGSLENISKTFYAMKKKHPYVDMYTLDNGAYSRGLRTYDQKLTKDDLRSYDNQNSGGGNFAYLLPEKQEAISKASQKFNGFESVALLNLKKLYPNKNVEIKFQNQGLYNDNGGRDFSSQASIKNKGNSQTDISLHNFDAARDYEIFVNGKKVNPDKNKKLYKDVLWNAAKSSGLHHLEEWDVAHIGLAKEGQGSAFREIRDKYPELLTKNLTGQNTIKSLQKLDKKDLLNLINNTTPTPELIAGISDYDKEKLRSLYTNAVKVYNK